MEQNFEVMLILILAYYCFMCLTSQKLQGTDPLIKLNAFYSKLIKIALK